LVQWAAREDGEVLVREEGPNEAIVIGQASHAWVSGQIARAWAGDVPLREHLELAATQHDIGMAEWDLDPTTDPETGFPTSFMRMPLETHLELWTAAPHKLLTQSSVAALAVSLHGTKLYERRDLNRLDPEQRAAVQAYLQEQRELQDALGHHEHHATIQRLMFTWDWLSLGLCLTWAPADFGDELHLGHDTVTPWPFAGDRVEFVCEGRRLKRHQPLEEGERVELRFALTRAPSGAP
jgi:hypothetical protein